MQEWIWTTIYFGYVKFFRTRLLTLNSEEIEKLVDEYDKDIKQIKQESLKLAWYMRGGLSYTEAMHLSIDERKIINEIIKENLETTKKTKMPFF